MDLIDGRMSPTAHRRLVQSAAEGNMNMLRVCACPRNAQHSCTYRNPSVLHPNCGFGDMYATASVSPAMRCAFAPGTAQGVAGSGSRVRGSTHVTSLA